MPDSPTNALAPSTLEALPANGTVELIGVHWNSSTWAFGVSASVWVIILLIGLIAIGVAARLYLGRRWGGALEIDSTEIGIGDAKFSLKPNLTDRQVGYAIWVELSTRKIGLPIDLDHDVIVEIYDSWYTYFSVTRDLIKSISVSRVRSKETRKIINLSIDVLNLGLRPHLTRWQARFRFWYDEELSRKAQSEKPLIDPQSIQRRFPQFDELSEDLLRVNKGLIAYRSAMEKLVYG